MKKVQNFSMYIQIALFTFTLLLGSLFVIDTEVEASGANIPRAFSAEHPYSLTGIYGNFEFVDLDDDGYLIMNQFRADINIYENLFGIYTKIPLAGADDAFGLNDDDYGLGNIAIGGKFVLLNAEQSVLTLGVEGVIPTTDDDLGPAAAAAYFRDFSYFVDDAFTVKPYAVFGTSSGSFALQGNVDLDIITNADEIEDDDVELVVKYGGVASITPNWGDMWSTSFLLELLFSSSTTFDDNITGGYITPGVRLGSETMSIGAGIQVPFGSDEVSDFANYNLLVDLLLKFGN
ncbi:MAG: hypothetical protein GTO02_06675 [Candidatus Dadabacteria bacterium]|nr:hypothetical protein [Candidatus Dadabacteria bacterium]NIQ14085.1 hypothetical protein [Candidatus Dadabacteria bacterium]